MSKGLSNLIRYRKPFKIVLNTFQETMLLSLRLSNFQNIMLKGSSNNNNNNNNIIIMIIIYIHTNNNTLLMIIKVDVERPQARGVRNYIIYAIIYSIKSNTTAIVHIYIYIYIYVIKTLIISKVYTIHNVISNRC